MEKTYPLEQLVKIKQRRLDEAERVLNETKEALIKEEEKQKTLEKERDKTLKHRTDKLEQLRNELDRGTTTDKIEMMRDYLRVVEEQLSQEERRVQDQVKEVKKAQKRVEEARRDMIQKRCDVEKLLAHRKEWQKGIKRAIKYKEELETDELGTSMHNLKKRKR